MKPRDVSSYIRDEVETLPPPEREKLQVKRLRAGIDRIANAVPHYREKLAQAGVTADSIRSLRDLVRLPFTTKADLHENYPFGLLAVPMKEVVRIHGSSGTTSRTLWTNWMCWWRRPPRCMGIKTAWCSWSGGCATRCRARWGSPAMSGWSARAPSSARTARQCAWWTSERPENGEEYLARKRRTIPDHFATPTRCGRGPS